MELRAVLSYWYIRPMQNEARATALEAGCTQAAHLLAQGQHAAAIDLLLPLAEAFPDAAKARRLLAQAFLLAHRFLDAIAACEALAQQGGDDPESRLTFGLALYNIGRFPEAAAALQSGLPAAPSADLRLMLARAWREAGEPDKAAAELERIRQAGLASSDAEAELYSLNQAIGAWDAFPEICAALKQFAENPETPVNPSVLESVPGIDDALLLRNARASARRIAAAAGPLVFRSAPAPAARIRLGYLSPDFQHSHPVGRHVLDIIRRHDRSTFEVLGYALKGRHPKNDAFHNAFDAMRYLDAQSDAEAARLIHSDGVEILVDLGGYQAGARPGILCHRPAPVQVNYLGYGGSMGADFVDYVIGDPVVIPPAAAACFSEAVAYLPDTYFPGFWSRPQPVAATRADFGLPENAFVFCVFGASYKITPPVFEIWLQLLHLIPKSVLWFRQQDPRMSENLRRRAIAAGLAPERLIFAKTVSESAHFARLSCADLFLDTFPFSAGSSAADALWADLPLLTCAGDTFISRMAASILHAAGLPDLVVHDLEAYASKACELAYDRALLQRTRAHLQTQRAALPLFDSPRLVRHLEAAYGEMSHRFRRGDSPATIAVEGPGLL